MGPVMVTVGDLADQMHVDRHAIYEWARRESDPLPLRTAIGRKRTSAVVVDELVEWWNRNSVPFREKEERSGEK